MIPKFRFWNIAEQKMYEVLSIHVMTGMVEVEGGKYFLVPQDGFLMQSTGLSDKNGVEIFEGDVVEWSTISGRKRGVGKIKHGGHVFLISSGKEVDHMNGSYSYNILGNIYEHPDLVEVKNDLS